MVLQNNVIADVGVMRIRMHGFCQPSIFHLQGSTGSRVGVQYGVHSSIILGSGDTDYFTAHAIKG